MSALVEVRDLQVSEVDLATWCTSVHLRYVREALARRDIGEVDYVAAWLGSELVGLGGIDYAKVPGVGTIWMLGVAKSRRSKGIGTAIVEHLEARAIDRHIDATALAVETDNSRAEALYMQLGYQRTGVVEEESWEQESESGEVTTHHAQSWVMRKALRRG